MFDLEDDASQREKCFTTVAQLPSFVDPKQIPRKKQPFSAILNHPFLQTVSPFARGPWPLGSTGLMHWNRSKLFSQKMYTKASSHHSTLIWRILDMLVSSCIHLIFWNMTFSILTSKLVRLVRQWASGPLVMSINSEAYRGIRSLVACLDFRK